MNTTNALDDRDLELVSGGGGLDWLWDIIGQHKDNPTRH